MVRHAVAREAVFALRREIAKIEGVLADRLAPMPEPPGNVATALGSRNDLAIGGRGSSLLQTGAETFDAALGGGLPRGGLVEIHGGQTRNAGAVAGFALAMTSLFLKEKGGSLFWIGTSDIFSETGFPYFPGLCARFGIGPDAVLFSEARQLKDILWIAEEAAGVKALSAIFLEIRGNPGRLDLTATRRLHRRALRGGRPLFLLREAAFPEPTAAPLRLEIAPARTQARSTLAGPLAHSIGPPAFTVGIGKNRNGASGQFTLEWDAARRGFRERREDHGTEDIGIMVSAPDHRQDPAAAIRAVLAFPNGDLSGTGKSAAGRQPAREKYEAYRSA